MSEANPSQESEENEGNESTPVDYNPEVPQEFRQRNIPFEEPVGGFGDEQLTHQYDTHTSPDFMKLEAPAVKSTPPPKQPKSALHVAPRRKDKHIHFQEKEGAEVYSPESPVPEKRDINFTEPEGDPKPMFVPPSDKDFDGVPQVIVDSDYEDEVSEEESGKAQPKESSEEDPTPEPEQEPEEKPTPEPTEPTPEPSEPTPEPEQKVQQRKPFSMQNRYQSLGSKNLDFLKGLNKKAGSNPRVLSWSERRKRARAEKNIAEANNAEPSEPKKEEPVDTPVKAEDEKPESSRIQALETEVANLKTALEEYRKKDKEDEAEMKKEIMALIPQVPDEKENRREFTKLERGLKSANDVSAMILSKVNQLREKEMKASSVESNLKQQIEASKDRIDNLERALNDLQQSGPQKITKPHSGDKLLQIMILIVIVATYIFFYKYLDL